MKRLLSLLIAVSMVMTLTACATETKVSDNDFVVADSIIDNDSVVANSIYDKYPDAYILNLNGEKASLNGEEIRSYEYIRKYDSSMSEPEYTGDEPDKNECYIAHDIIYYPEIDMSAFTKENYDGETEWVTHYTNAELSEYLFATLPVLGEDLPVNMMHSAEEAYDNPVLHITQPGEYIVEGNWNGQIYIDLGDKDESFADESKKVTLILNGANVNCSVAPALVFYSAYECDNEWETREEALSTIDISDAGAKVILADGTENNFTGANVYRLLKPKYKNDETKVQKKLAKMDGAFYSFVSMLIDGSTGILNINSTTFEGLDTELHLQIDGGYVNIVTQDDGINVNEDHVSVFTQNGGHVMIFAGQGAEGDVVDSNGYININGGFIAGTSPSVSDNMLDSEDGTYVSDEATVVENVAGIKGGPGRPGEFDRPEMPPEGFDGKEPPEHPKEIPMDEGNKDKVVGDPREYSTFAASEMHDLKLATLFIDGKEYSITDTESLKWIEDGFSRADELKGWPNCPYDAELILVRNDGVSFKVQVATDSCNNLKAGDIWYCYHTETDNNMPFYDLFGIKVLFGKVVE